MLTNREWVNHAVVKVDGGELSPEAMSALVEIAVDATLHLPTLFEMRFNDTDLILTDSDTFQPGKPVTIELGAGQGDLAPIVTGEITAVEADYTQELTTILIVRGYDRSYRLNREPKTRVFVQVKISDIVEQIASEAGLRPTVEATSQVFEHIFQDNQTDLDFLQDHARRLGFEIFVDDQTLYFRKPEGNRGSVELSWGEELRSFRPRLTLTRQVDEVVVRGWNPKNKQKIMGQASRGNTATRIGAGDDGGAMATQAFSSEARHVVVRRPISEQGEADTLAQAILDDINSDFVEAEGTTLGNPTLLAGTIVTIGNLGNRFSGDYMVTSATHTYRQEGYRVAFRVEGAYARTLADLLVDTHITLDNAATWAGVFPAIVTNNQDPEEMGRVKLKFPWMNDDLESHWARIASIGGGAERGIYMLPEVNDEVLVAFEHGNFNRPYVIGTLWNGQDATPETGVVQGGDVNIRTIKSRTGHVIRISDDSSSSFILIEDATGKNKLHLDTSNNVLTIESGGEVKVTSGGDTTIEAASTVNIEGKSNVKIEGGASVEIKGSGSVSVESSGELKLSGSVVNIN